MADSSSQNKETPSPEKQQQSTPQPTNVVTQTTQHQQSVTSVGSSVTPPPPTRPITPPSKKEDFSTHFAKGSSSAQSTQRRQIATGGYCSTTPPSRPYVIGGGSSSNSQNIAVTASGFQMIEYCGGIVSAMEHGNVVAAAHGQEKKKRKASEMNVPETMTPICCICGRSFRSWKALFGHMRSHPDRQWRGCFPPPVEEQFDDAIANNSQGIIAQGGEQEPQLGDIDLNQPHLEENDDEYVTLDFDLNLPPADQNDHDDEDGGAN